MKPTESRFGKQIRKAMEEIDRELAAKMITRTATNDEVYRMLLELGRYHGYDMERGAKAILHPANLPIGYTSDTPAIMVSAAASEHLILFIGTPYVRQPI